MLITSIENFNVGVEVEAAVTVVPLTVARVVRGVESGEGADEV